MPTDNTSNISILLNEDFKRLGAPVKAEFAGLRVDAYLAQSFPFFSRNRWQKRIDNAQVLINGQRCRSSDRISAGDDVYMFHPPAVEPEVDTEIKILFAQDGVLCAAKPPGLPMHEGGPFRTRTFARALTDLCGDEWSAIHRLDKETSGVVLCGATEKIRRALATDLRLGTIRKEYLAIINGVPERPTWFVDGAIGNCADSRIRIKTWVVENGGLSALTEFMIEEKAAHHALIRAFPRTGRTNQIRIHAAYAGHHLLGDKLFYPDEEVFLDYWENGMSQRLADITGHWRCCLHAHALSFRHPGTGESHRIECPAPLDFIQAWEALRLKI